MITLEIDYAGFYFLLNASCGKPWVAVKLWMVDVTFGLSLPLLTRPPQSSLQAVPRRCHEGGATHGDLGRNSRPTDPWGRFAWLRGIATNRKQDLRLKSDTARIHRPTKTQFSAPINGHISHIYTHIT